MATKKYPTDKSTYDKIHKLFAYRRITDLLQSAGLSRNKAFVSKLIDVQYRIYMLDAYLESRWDLDKENILKLWEPIHQSLATMGYEDKAIKKLTASIRNYERIERNCRKQKWPTKEDIHDFYYTKACDVRLIRKLIYDAHPALRDTWKLGAWKYYDIITEINDDIEDVNEDLQSYNGNRFLISILRKGSAKTHKEYLKFLAKTTSDAADYFKERMNKGNNSQLAAWTGERSRETALLLEKNTDPKLQDSFSSSLLLVKMK